MSNVASISVILSSGSCCVCIDTSSCGLADDCNTTQNHVITVILHDCITYLSKYLFIVLLLYRLQIKWEIKKKTCTTIVMSG
jgi:hypothetical protein